MLFIVSAIAVSSDITWSLSLTIILLQFRPLSEKKFLLFFRIFYCHLFWICERPCKHRRKVLCNFRSSSVLLRFLAKKSQNYRFQRVLVRICSENLSASILVKFVVYSDIQEHLQNLQPATLLKRSLRQRCFPINLANFFFRTVYLCRYSLHLFSFAY